MRRLFLTIALATIPVLFSVCHLFAGGAAEMCQARMKEKRACQTLFFLEFDGCNGDAICEENAMAIQLGCMTIPTDSCGPRGGKGGGGK